MKCQIIKYWVASIDREVNSSESHEFTNFYISQNARNKTNVKYS